MGRRNAVQQTTGLTLVLRYLFIFTSLAAVSLGLLALPFDGVNAGPPKSTPTPTLDIRTKLQPSRTLDAGPRQSDDGRFYEASLPPELEERPISPKDQQTFNAIADACVLQGYPSENIGDTGDMWAGYDEYLSPDGQIARSLVEFDIASLPPNQTITTATLRLRLVGSWDYPNTNRTITTYRISSSWPQSSVTWNNRPGYGGAYGSKDILSGAYDWYEFDVTGLVTAWYGGTYANHGIMLRGPEVSGTDASWRAFSTREGSYTPQLVVEYAPPPVPRVDSITPDSGINNGVVHITDLAGANFQTGATVKLSRVGGADIINATNTVVVNDTQITCDFDLTGAAAGAWDVVVTNSGVQSGTLPGGFTVEAAPPQVDSITPDFGTSDGVVHITDLAGAYFQTGATVKLSKAGGADIVSATNLVVVSDAQISCDFDLTGAATGAWDVEVTNSDSHSGTLPGGFTVFLTTPPPQVDSITPDSGTKDTLVHISDLAGDYFQTGATVKLSRAGEPDINATNLVVMGDAQITCDFDLTGAASGAWDVVVTNQDSQSGTLPGGFAISYAPLQVGFTASPTAGVAPLTVTFTNTSTGDYTASLWAFGDGITSAVESPTHTYTAPGSYTVTLTASGPGGTGRLRWASYITVRSAVYLPLALRRWPPIPHTPVLNAISNADGSGNYTVDWNTAELAESYTLEQATSASFTDAIPVYQGTGTSYTVSDQPVGTYYYHVKATNTWGDSGWSNVQSVTVQPPGKLYPTADAALLKSCPNLNTGSRWVMFVGYGPADDGGCSLRTSARSVLRFDLSVIPAAPTISEARLYVKHVGSIYETGHSEWTKPVTVYRVDESWSELSVTWNSMPSYTEAYGSTPFTYRPAGWTSFDVTDLVRGWVNDDFPNHGLILVGPESSGSDRVIFVMQSRDTYGTDSDPYLVITYAGLSAAK